MSDFILLTDSDDAAVTAAAGQLESWSAQHVDIAQLADAIDGAGVRALLLVTTDPTLLRTATERAHSSTIPVIIGCVDDIARRRAVELRAEEWYRIPAPPEEIAARIRSARLPLLNMMRLASKRYRMPFSTCVATGSSPHTSRA